MSSMFEYNACKCFHGCSALTDCDTFACIRDELKELVHRETVFHNLDRPASIVLGHSGGRRFYDINKYASRVTAWTNLKRWNFPKHPNQYCGYNLSSSIGRFSKPDIKISQSTLYCSLALRSIRESSGISYGLASFETLPPYELTSLRFAWPPPLLSLQTDRLTNFPAVVYPHMSPMP